MISAEGLAMLLALGSLPPCQIDRRAPLVFSSEVPDEVRVTTGTGECYLSDMLLTIRSAGGVEVYRYEAPFKRHTPVMWDDPDLPALALDLLADIVDAKPVSSTALPPYGEENGEFPGASPELPEERYEHYRAKEVPLFCHPLAYEVFQCIVFN